MSFRTVSELGHINGARVIVRADCNVPIENGAVADDSRLQVALPTLKLLAEAGAKVVLISHIGEDGRQSLKPVADYLSKYFPVSLVSELREIQAALAKGRIVILENIRRFEGETANDPQFAASLASLGDIFVNEAFSVSHRRHASIVGVPKLLPSYAGLRFHKEVSALSRVFQPERPFLFIIGGAKPETKLPLIEKFLNLADTVFVGGALANDFFKARGFETGCSKTSEVPVSQEMLDNPRLMLPSDVVAVGEGKVSTVKSPSEVSVSETIVDAGPQTLSLLKQKIDQSKMILWNGPLGVYEQGHSERTETLACSIAESAAVSIVGGGDTLASIKKLDLKDKFTLVSTGGGAMLQFLLNGTLPGIEALENSSAG